MHQMGLDSRLHIAGEDLYTGEKSGERVDGRRVGGMEEAELDRAVLPPSSAESRSCSS